MRTVAILGSTGSIGTQALEIIRRHPDQFQVVGLAAGGGNLGLLERQAREFRVPMVGTSAPDSELALTGDQELVSGPAAASVVAGLGADVVLNGITGSGGLGPPLAA
ncbi:MAG: 1-deoxy-D-xylulose-5-phosphate reductoisomerase, partial [Promicromonosporaceae bacterium]|nr:1-deoxy-D-xylulose-5-phosphate reductoisomerase [Promicromonosporaceae bacterium]